jgi:diacylglycerol kinase family enzyme
MAILPGGTANVMSAELGIPQELREAAQLLCIDAPTRALDMGRMGERMFLLRVSIGLAADMVKATDRERKERYGALAYAMSFLEQMRDSNESDYTLTLDGERVNSRGVTCLINNAGHLGSMNLRLAADIDVSDGLLDVFVLGQGEPALLRSMLMQMAPGQLSQSLEQLIDNNFQRWKVRDVTVEIDSPQTVQADGEVLGNTPVTASVLPQAVRVVVPPPSDETQT